MKRDQTFNLLFGAEVLAKVASSPPGVDAYSSASNAIVDLGEGSTFRLDAASGNVTLLRAGRTLASFTGAERDKSLGGEDGIFYSSGPNELGFACIPIRLGSQYTFVADYSVNVDYFNPGATDASRFIALGGAPTASFAELSSGDYRSWVSAHLLYVDGTSDQSLTSLETGSAGTFDVVSGVLKGKAKATEIGSGGKDYSISFTATLAPGTTRFQGTATTGNGAQGKLTGGFFGPGGNEYGFVFAIKDGNAYLTGYGSGKR
jgi:hypothetical protein